MGSAPTGYCFSSVKAVPIDDPHRPPDDLRRAILMAYRLDLGDVAMDLARGKRTPHCMGTANVCRCGCERREWAKPAPAQPWDVAA